MNGRALRGRHLGRQVSRGAEAVHAQPTTGRQRGPPECPVPDDAGAQEGSKLVVGVSGGQRIRVLRRHNGVFGVTPIGVPAGVAG